MPIRHRPLPVSDLLIATIGERPMQLVEITRVLDKEGYGHMPMQLVDAHLKTLLCKRLVFRADGKFSSNRKGGL